MAFTVTAANVDERDVVPNLYDKIYGLLIGDKGFISGEPEGGGGGPRDRPPDAAAQKHAGRP